MNKFKILILALTLPLFGLGQAAYITPNPTDGVEEITIYIDISQSTENGLKTMLENNPDEPVYIWSWNPSEPSGGNGDWGASNPDNEMTKVAPMLYTKTINIVDFYGVDPSILFQNGISCLAKLADGNSFSDLEIGEAKTEDFNIDVIPKLCDREFCVFPEIADEDDFISITYDNNYEDNPDYQNAGDNSVYVHLRVKQDGFSSTEYVSADNVSSTTELQMKPVDGEPGHFRFTFIPKDFFSDVTIEEDGAMRELLYYIIVDGQPIPTPPSAISYGLLPCD